MPLLSPLHRTATSPIENWNPFEVAMFESSLHIYGKNFHTVQKVIGTKSCKEIVEFYYVWKKTHRYKVWKERYYEMESDDDDEDGVDFLGDKEKNSGRRGNNSGTRRGCDRTKPN